MDLHSILKSIAVIFEVNMNTDDSNNFIEVKHYFLHLDWLVSKNTGNIK